MKLPITYEAFLTISAIYFIVNSFISGWFWGSEYSNFLTKREKLKIFIGCYSAFLFGVLFLIATGYHSIYDFIIKIKNLKKRSEAKEDDMNYPWNCRK